MVEMSESFIHPFNVKFPFSVTSDMNVYTIREIAATIATGEPCVMDVQGQCPLPVEQLLFFEPYFGLGRELIQELFEQNPEERVPEAFLAQLAKQLYHRRKLYQQMICPDPSILEEIQTETDPFRQCLNIFRHYIGESSPLTGTFTSSSTSSALSVDETHWWVTSLHSLHAQLFITEF